MIYIQLFLSFLQIGLFSVGGGYAAIPLVQSLMDHDDGVYESYHDRGNDAGTDCGQFSNLCRNSDSGTSGGGCGNLGMYFPILYHCIGIGIHISALPWRLCDGKYFRQSSPSGSGADRRCWTFDATGSSSSRDKWGEDDPVGQSGSFFGSFYSAP